MAIFHAFPCGKMNQSTRMENENNEILYEGNLVKFHLFGAHDFEFIDHAASTTVAHKIGKTKSVEQGTMGVSMSSASYFKMDGKNCFDILEEKGFSFSLLPKLDILHPEFALKDQSGNQLAVYKMNVVGEREEGVFAIGSKQNNIVITTESEDLETIFFGAFILSRVDFSLYLL